MDTTATDFLYLAQQMDAADDFVAQAPEQGRTLAEVQATADAAVQALVHLTTVCRALLAEVQDLRERVERPETPTTREFMAMIRGAEPVPF